MSSGLYSKPVSVRLPAFQSSSTHYSDTDITLLLMKVSITDALAEARVFRLPVVLVERLNIAPAT